MIITKETNNFPHQQWNLLTPKSHDKFALFPEYKDVYIYMSVSLRLPFCLFRRFFDDHTHFFVFSNCIDLDAPF